MKARVKATGYIVNVELSHYIDDVAWYISKCHISYPKNELEFIDDPEDYWTRLEHQAAIAAMQGMLSNPNITYKDISTETICNHVAERVKEIAQALVEKMKEERK